ncbi:hypothetical protein N7492_004158 [Penicillium capsulatum]|uniref:FAD-binding PCMH-type domain-containing protein n=1 Tax=Penicillium capsulatum TaxID=69766 RepID=A0A9W9IMN3_9EURO|nr:hypothetical protein N7492_004158 [Penicillium capsulatum]KAJ6121272.1 hypothetical protein N7512_003737 [Penicillium capsulatum]
MEQLISFLETKGLHYATPTSSDYGDLRPTFIVRDETVPAVIVRPRSMEEAASLVSCLVKTRIPFSVRGGGHDMFGRSQVDNAVTIDMRDIAHVEVNADSQTARVGGGVISMDLLTKLQQHGLTVSHPATPTVGFVGWAIHGGYGLLSTHYGLGIDQIVGAKIVDAQGHLREADEAILTAIRGAGGVVGVIVELTIKVYPTGQILAGMVFYESSDLPTTIQRYGENYQKAAEEGIPSALSIERFVINGPTGKTFMIFFVWSSDKMEEGQAWLSKVSSWTPVAMSTVTPTTIADFNEGAKSIVPNSAYGRIFSLTVKRLTPEVLDVIGQHAPRQPMNPEILFGIHEVRAECPIAEPFPCVFNMREPHLVIEIIPVASTAEGVKEVTAWGQAFYDALAKTNPANILGRYIPFTPTNEIDLHQVYGDRFDTLRKIKHEYDPENVFKNALVKP